MGRFRWRRTALGLAASLALAAGALSGLSEIEARSAAGTSYSTLIPNSESVVVNAYETVAGLLLLRDVARRVTAGATTDLDRLQALVEWTHENVRPQFASPERVVKDNVYGIVRRGFGYCDQSDHVFATLATLSGYQARVFFLIASYESPHTVAQVLVDGRWIFVDPWLGIILTDRLGRPLSVEDVPAQRDRLGDLGYTALGIGAEDFIRGKPFTTFPYAPLTDVIGRIVAKARQIPVADQSVAVVRSPGASAPAMGGNSTSVETGQVLTYDQARRAHLLGDYTRAVGLYRSIDASRVDAELAQSTRFFTGLALLRTGRYREAIEEFDRSLSQDPGDPWRHSLHRYRGEARLAIGDVDGAVADLRSAGTPGAKRLLLHLGRGADHTSN